MLAFASMTTRRWVTLRSPHSTVSGPLAGAIPMSSGFVGTLREGTGAWLRGTTYL